MKKILTIFSILIISSLGIARAEDYPQKLIGEDFTTLPKFRGVFTKMYADQPDLTEVCRRALQWPDFWITDDNGEKTSLFSVANCEKLTTEGQLSNFLNIHKKNIKNFNTLKDKFEERFNLELELLKTENNLRRETGLAYIFADGHNHSNNSAEGTTSDSPFDLVSDLNEIDEILFGEKAEKPKPSFAEKTEREISAEIPTDNDNEEYWLNQTEEKLPSQSDNFDNYKNNLAGGLWRSGIKVLREKLNVLPLYLGYVGKTVLDKFATDGTFGNPGFDANTSEKPPTSEDKPEAVELAFNPLKALDAYVQKYILEEEAYKVHAQEGDTERNKHNSEVMAQKDRQHEIIMEKLARFEKANARNSENFTAHRDILNMQMFNEYLKLLRAKLRFLREEVFPDLLNKPQHSS